MLVGDRQTGRTTEQLRAAPYGSIFVWVDQDLYYPKKIAHDLSRFDVVIVGPSIFDMRSSYLRGRTDIITLDHACRLTPEQSDVFLEYCRLRTLLFTTAGSC